MEIITEPIPGVPGRYVDFLGFNKQELELSGDIIIKALEKELEKAEKKYEYYKDIQESGEATTKQQTMYFEYEEKVNKLADLLTDFRHKRKCIKY